MKRKIFLTLACSALLLAAGCGSDAGNSSLETSNNDSPVVENENESADDESENTSNDVDISDISEEPDTTTGSDNSNGELYSLGRTRHNVQNNTEDDSFTLLYASYDVLDFQNNGFDALSQSVTDWQTQRTAWLEETIKSYTDMAQEYLDSEADFYGFSLYQSIMPMRLDKHVLSLKENYYDYVGGAHDSSFTNGINFDAATGELLTLENVVTDYTAFSEAAKNYVCDYLKTDTFADFGFYDDYETTIRENFKSIPWYFSASGITLIYNTYEIAPYAAGMLEISLPAETFHPYIREEYRLAAEPGYANVHPGEVLTVDAPAGQLKLSVTDGISYYDGSAEDTSAMLTLNDTNYSLDTYGCWLRNCYLIRQAESNGRLILMMDGDMASDDYTTRFFDITDGSIKELASVEGSVSMPGTDTVEFNQRVNVLGTYSADMTYDISGENAPAPVDTEYVLISPTQELVTVKELPVTKDGEQTTLPVGTSLLPIATDANSYITVKDTVSNQEYTISFTREDYLIKIDGIEEFEYFMLLPYAG